MLSANRRNAGFSLIELLLVLAIIGIITTIAIPAYLGQRRRAKVVGDAQSNARALSMMLEARRADVGLYPVGTYNWTASGTVPTASKNPAPGFAPPTGKGATMSYQLVVNAGGVSYNLTVTSIEYAGKNVLTMDQNGAMHTMLQD